MDDLCCRRLSWHHREAYLLENDLVRLVTLTGGGHIAEFRFKKSTGFSTLSPLWIPPWQTIEPYRYNEKRHRSKYGTVTEGKLLSGLAGHNLCLDYFGPPSEEEAAQGLSFHGEAPILKWRKRKAAVTAKHLALTLSVRLPVAGLSFRREIRLHQGESVAYFEETVTNERKADHFFHWTQHVTLAPPFLSHLESIVTLPGTKGITYPHGYDEGNALLSSGRFFRWPTAPAHEGGSVDLTRPFSRCGLGFVVGVLLDAKRKLGFVTAFNLRHRLLIAYCFRRSDYPWVTLWEENQATAAAPWKGRTQARGLEFGTTALPVQRREAFAKGTLFDTPTFTWVPARGRRVIRYIALLCEMPPDFETLRDIKLDKQQILLVGSNPNRPVRLPASGTHGLS